jgi:glycosyltransferase involved in cell wall biosynthesis
MRILVLAALYPPNHLGGAEVSAANLTQWLGSQGHDMAALTAAGSGQAELHGDVVDGIRIWRLRMPHIYPVAAFPEAPRWQKPIWHLQDHVDPRNRARLAAVLDAFRPDFVNIHLIQGLGHNALVEIASRNIPTLYVLHDLGLACIRMSMFRDGHDCPAPCRTCRLSARIKARTIARFGRIGFASPSRANLAMLETWTAISDRPRAVILNPNRYASPRTPRTESSVPRLLYVGRLHRAKGVDLLLEAAVALAPYYPFKLGIVGDGPDEARLWAQYGGQSWLRFHGRVVAEAIGDHMQSADLLCVPSLWRENSPGVVVQALTLGLPVIGSDTGGVPELIRQDETGLLVKPGDIDAWRSALEGILREPQRLEAWRRNAGRDVDRFDPDRLGARMLAFMQSIAGEAHPPGAR